MLNHTHNGVLLPADMQNASVTAKDEYAAKVKTGNAAFVTAYFALEEQAATLGLTVEDLDQ